LSEGYAVSRGARLSYRDSGGPGVPVVFVHAATGSTAMWTHQEPAFVTAGFRFIAYDRRGHGRTIVDEPSADATVVDDLDALVGHLGVDRFHLVGTAAGGAVCFDYAIAFPDRLLGLVVANSIGGLQDPESLELNRRLRPSPFEEMPPDFRELGPAYRAADPEGTQRWLEIARTSRVDGACPAQPAPAHLTLAALESIRVPTLLLTGDADLYAPPTLMERFAKRIPGSTFVVVPAAGHSLYWEQPDVFNRAIIEFIERQSPR